jgi:peptide/nickel transport system substrate-binding protein
VLALAALVVAAWLLYPLIFGSKKVRQPDEVTVRIDSAPATFNPYLSGGHSTSTYLARQILQTLGELEPKTLEMQPVLVTAIPQSRMVADGPRKGQFAFDFAIRPEAVWDNGSPVTGNDVAFSFKLIFHPNLPTEIFRGYLRYMSGMEVDAADPKKFTVFFREYYMLALETLCSLPIYPAYNYDPSGLTAKVPLDDFLDSAKVAQLAADESQKAFSEAFKQPKFANDPKSISGSGPYRLELMNEQGAILVKKENWWGDKLAEKHPILSAFPKKLTYKVVKDDPTLVNMLNNGELDLVGGNITPATFLELKAVDSLAAKYQFLALGTTQYNRWVLNHRNPILSDVKVRRALRHLLDYDYFINQVQRGLAVRIANPMPPNRPYYNKELPLPDFDIAKAKALLAEAGWADSNNDGILDKNINGKNTPLSFRLMVATTIKTNELISNSLKESARQAGLDLIIVSSDLSTMTTDTRSGNYDSALLGVALFPGLVDYYQRYHSKSLIPVGDNRAAYVSPVADSLIVAIRTQPDPKKRDELYKQLQKVFYDDAVEVILFAPLQRIIISKKFEPGLESENRPGYYEHLARLRNDN